MRALNPKRSRPRAIDDLRLAIACLPRATRVAMLEGINRNPIIVGAYSTSEGICPMLAAHRAGGRTAFIGFADAWDRFAQRDRVTRRSRRATERELLVLRAHLEASLLEEASSLGAVIAEHQTIRRRRTVREEASAATDRRAGRECPGGRDPSLERSGDPSPERSGDPSPERSGDPSRERPGDPDRSRELGRAGGWAWTRLFRRYDEYERALRRLEDEARRAQVPAGRPG